MIMIADLHCSFQRILALFQNVTWTLDGLE